MDTAHDQCVTIIFIETVSTQTMCSGIVSAVEIINLIVVLLPAGVYYHRSCIMGCMVMIYINQTPISIVEDNAICTLLGTQ